MIMTKNEPQFKWKEQSLAENCEEIECPQYDEIKDFRLDPSGCYVLIRVNQDINKIEVADVNNDHQIIKMDVASLSIFILQTAHRNRLLWLLPFEKR